MVSTKEKAAPENLKPLAKPLNRGTTNAAQVALPQSPILRRGGLTFVVGGCC